MPLGSVKSFRKIIAKLFSSRSTSKTSERDGIVLPLVRWRAERGRRFYRRVPFPPDVIWRPFCPQGNSGGGGWRGPWRGVGERSACGYEVHREPSYPPLRDSVLSCVTLLLRQLSLYWLRQILKRTKGSGTNGRMANHESPIQKLPRIGPPKHTVK